MPFGILVLILFLIFFFSVIGSTRTKTSYRPTKPSEPSESFEVKLTIAKSQAKARRKAEFVKRFSYRASHSPWNPIGQCCIGCGFSILDIDQNQWYCSGKYGQKGLTATEAFLRYDQPTQDWYERTYPSAKS